jgi:hypothetical protein
MSSSFFSYLQRLELMAFFSGYPLIYLIILFFAENLPLDNSYRTRLVSLLPIAYALLGTLYLGLQLKNLYPDYSFENIKQPIQMFWLKIWGIFSILFWIPSLRKKPVLTLLHSTVFFLFLVRDLFFQLFSLSADKNIIRNDMKIFTVSLFLILGTYGFILLFDFLGTRCGINLRS